MNSNIFQKYIYTYYLQQCQVARECIVKVDLGIYPRIVMSLVHLQAHCHVGHVSVVHHIALNVHALVEFSSKELHAHYAEDEPENQTNQHHMEDGRYGLDEGVNHHLLYRI